MINKVLSYLQYGNRFCGIEHTTKNGNDIIISTILKHSKKELDIETAFEANTIEEASQIIKKNQHAFLIINNDKVLSKQIESEQKDALKLVYKAFPNINIDDFLYEVFSQKNTHFISLCRKSYVQKIIEDYKKNNIFIISVSIGNSVISVIKSFIKTNEIYSSNSKILIEDKLITKIEKNDDLANQSYSLNGLSVSNTCLLSFSGALNSILKIDVTETNFNVNKELLLGSFKQHRFFQQFLKFAGLFLLLGLLINFLVFNHYFNSVNELTQISAVNQSTKSKIVTLNEAVSKKQKMVDDLLKSNGSRSSFYVNEIIHSLPKSIMLSEYNYQPLVKRIKTEKEIKIEGDIIKISGTSNDSKLFSNWISQLEKNNWVVKINIEDYGATSNSNSDFTIKIEIHNDKQD
ncbi:PilN domain-containing protein [Olleya namhaensis]|uniref:Uncharacterized protein n=1 Tax=Olleya namhaensis TaxID=1144750 RepID=A0A1I3MUG7_9FLAO|nr:PilN domain-containing protein [Olleya namhaensis]SFJ00627.1 hypothetical protein SAMN05443431_103310 [Olleya namhaensis]